MIKLLFLCDLSVVSTLPGWLRPLDCGRLEAACFIRFQKATIAEEEVGGFWCSSDDGEGGGVGEGENGGDVNNDADDERGGDGDIDANDVVDEIAGDGDEYSNRYFGKGSSNRF